MWERSSYGSFVFHLQARNFYEACPENKDTKVLNKYNIFNLQKQRCEWIACT